MKSRKDAYLNRNVKGFSEYSNVDDWNAYRYEHYRRIKERATRLKIPFNLDPEDIVYPEICPILGIALTRKLSRGNYPTLDRTDNTKGYIKGNVRVISHKANVLKNDNSIETLESILRYMRGEL